MEVFHDGEWGTVCDDDWDGNDAALVCAFLGIAGFSEAVVSSSVFGEGSGTIWMDNVDCAGDEGSIERCSRNEWGVHNCGHDEDAGVRCDTSTTGTYNCSLRTSEYKNIASQRKKSKTPYN